MNQRKQMMIGAIAGVLFVAGCGQPAPPSAPAATPQPAQAAGPPPGRVQRGNPDDARMRLMFAADGTVINADGRFGGNWEFGGEWGPNPPASLGRKVAVIEVWTHDGTEVDLKKTDGSSEHVHSGPANPPWNTHCHGWYQIGPTWYWYHC